MHMMQGCGQMACPKKLLNDIGPELMMNVEN